MADRAKDTIICISGNGNTVSSSENAARRMLVATTEGVLDFRRDGPGADWQLQDGLLLPGNHVSCLVYDERNDLLFAGMHFDGGLLMSRDRGATWEKRDAGVASGHAYTLLVQYDGDRTILNLGTEPVMFYRSWDLGESWTAFPSCTQVEGTEHWIFPRSQPHIKHIAAHPSEPETLYICVEQGDLLKTTDGGHTWTSLHSMERADDKFRRDQHRVVFYRTPNEIFFTTGIGLYHTTDAGESWERLTDPSHPCGYPDPFFVHPTKDKLFMQGAGGNPNPGWAAEGTAHPQFMVSTDHGKSWVQKMEGMAHPVRGNLEIAAMHDSVEGGLEFYSGSAVGELYVSRDEGESWTFATGALPPMSKGPHFRWFLTPEDREAYENKLRGMNAFA
ncbi:MAG: glycosyl hydrolase [Novosphingobium sp.]|nr:glycosyl hydrolase [Novosphingobium sp.]MBO9604251.1 glycosyl hydrolase [Novosphingobium sp.]